MHKPRASKLAFFLFPHATSNPSIHKTCLHPLNFTPYITTSHPHSTTFKAPGFISPYMTASTLGQHTFWLKSSNCLTLKMYWFFFSMKPYTSQTNRIYEPDRWEVPFIINVSPIVNPPSLYLFGATDYSKDDHNNPSHSTCPPTMWICIPSMKIKNRTESVLLLRCVTCFDQHVLVSLVWSRP